ncbi:MAG TPA: Ig-like domain-containing protein, partial [Opitutaceae bacterium]|nr:Ig-like domain-containing protein [Opitutaceae bacterium]
MSQNLKSPLSASPFRRRHAATWMFQGQGQGMSLLRLIRWIMVGVCASLVAASAAQLTLTWTDNSDNESGFKVERSTAGAAFVSIGSTAANATTYTDTNVTAGVQYSYRVYAFNSAGESGYTNTAAGMIALPSNTAPTISSLSAVSIPANSGSGVLSFTVGDAETSAGALTVTASSSNTSLIRQQSVTLGGSGSSRTVALTPELNQTGSAVITLTVSDGSATASTSFTVTVTAVNTRPTISDITNRVIEANGSTGAVAFTIGDAETSPGSLLVSVSSSNPTLVPEANIIVGGSGASRTLAVTPAINQSGVATITVTVSDGNLTASDSFVLTVNVLNTPPTISDISNRTIASGASTGSIAFSIADGQTAANLLAVTASSTNLTLVPSANIVLGGSGSSRTLTATPVAGRSGTTTITLTVSDGVYTASESFVLTVEAINTPPTITDIPGKTIDANATTGAMPFTIGDAETPAASLSVSAVSSNPVLVPASSIVLEGSGASRSITVVPAANQSGTATITVTVTDGLATATDTFVLTVNALNTAPSISSIASRTIDANTSTGPLAFTIADAETAIGNLTVSVTSSNTVLVPNNRIVLGGTGGNRTVSITPAPNQIGSTTLTLSVSDGNLTSNSVFVLTVAPVATAPTISRLDNVEVSEGGSTGALPFVIGHATTAPASLRVTASSSNPTLVPVSGIVLGGADANRTVSVVPTPQKTGSAIITIEVSDGTLSASQSFTVTVKALNAAPTISGFNNVSIKSSHSTGAIAFTVNDDATPAGNLVLSALSTNQALLPVSNIVFG